MKRTICIFALLGFILALTPGALNADVVTGKAAPNFTLEDTNGNTHSLSDFRGKFVVLEWLNHDCPFVRKHYDSQNMQNMQKAYTGQGVVWLSISSSAHGKQGHYHPKEANKLTKSKGAAPSAVLMDFDGVVGQTYGAQTTPHMYLISPQGVLFYQGAIDSTPSTSASDIPSSQNYVQMALDAALAGQPVGIMATKAYGCSVKY